MSRRTYHIILLIIFLILLGVTGWIVHWNIQFRKDLYLNTFIEIDDRQEQLKKFADPTHFAEDFQEEIEKFNEQHNDRWQDLEQRVKQAPQDSIPFLFIEFVRDRLDVSPNSFYKTENGQLYYYLEKGPNRIKLKLQNNLLTYKIVEVENLANTVYARKDITNEEPKGQNKKKSKSQPEMKDIRQRIHNIDSFAAAVVNQVQRANQQTDGKLKELENRIKTMPGDSVILALIQFTKSQSGNTYTNYKHLENNQVVFVVNKVYPKADDTAQLNLAMKPDKTRNLKIDKPLNLGEFLIEKVRLSGK